MFNFNRPQIISSITSRRNRSRQTKKARSPERRRARFEFLEDRRVLAVLTVNSVGDVAADTSALTLRDAITLVNSAGDPTSLGQSSMPAAWASQIAGNFGSNDTIQFDPSLAGTPIVLAQGELLINSPMTITGLPAAGTTIDGNSASRIFEVTAAAGAVSLDALTLTRGMASSNGGAIYSESALTVNNCTISDSSAPNGAGGGIFALAGVTITNSAILDNDTGNNVGAAAGIQSVSGAVTLTNSTLAYNYGGGILAEHGPVTVTNSTVFNNDQFGIQAGTLASDGPVTIASSIVAGDWNRDVNSGYTGDLSYGSATPASVTNSLIGDGSGAGLTEAPVGSPDANGNFIGGPSHGVIDPKLGSLDYNGGPTETFMLLPGSPAIDTGANPDNLATDQRGAPFVRTAGAQTDMGAFEIQTSKLAPTLTLSAPDSVFPYFHVTASIAGPNSAPNPYTPELEGVPLSLTYYAGLAANGTPVNPFAGLHSGPYTVAASFPGSADYAAASATATFNITQAPTTTTLTNSSGTTVFGQSVDLSAIVGGGSPYVALGLPRGSIQIWDGTTLLQTGDVRDFYAGALLSPSYSDTGADFVVWGLSAGTHTLTATYEGNGDFIASTSAAVTVAVRQASTSINVVSSAPDQLIGQDVTFTAYVGAVSPGSGYPTGSVTFWDGDTKLGTNALSNSIATFTTSALSVGAHDITAVYDGDSNFAASPPSTVLYQTIHRAETATTVTSSAAKSTSSYGQTVTFTANVGIVAPDTGVPSGTIQFQVDGQNLGSPVPLDVNDNASITTASLALGSHRITAVYSGNSTVDTSSGLLPGTISTYAGGGGQYLLPTSAKAAVLNTPAGVAVDPSGDLFIADAGSNTIRKVDARTGSISVVVGVPFNQAYNELFPTDLIGMVCDASGDLYYSDPYDNAVEKLSPLGIVTTVAGTFGYRNAGYSGDGGPATSAHLYLPSGLALDSAGDLFIAQAGGIVRKVTPDGIITTVAGGGSDIGDGGPATAALLFKPMGLAVNSAGDLFIADNFDSAVREVDRTTGIISTVAKLNYLNGSEAQGLAFDAAGNLFIADSGSHDVIELTRSGAITTFAGINQNGGYSGDGGPATAAQLNAPIALATDSAGDLFIADTNNEVIRKVNSAGTINTVAGGGSISALGNGGPATDVELPDSSYVATDAAGDLFVANPYTNVVREVAPDGIIHAFAGTGTAGYNGDGGAATASQLNAPSGLAVDSAGDVFIADGGNNVVRKVTPSGAITTVAGNGTAGYSGDGQRGTAASLHLTPYSSLSSSPLAVDANGNLFISDDDNGVIRELSAAGIISTVALPATFEYGSTSLHTADYLGSNVGNLGAVAGLAVDSAGDLFISDSGSGGDVVLELSQSGSLSVVAGALNNVPSHSANDGEALGAAIGAGALAFDPAGDLLIAGSVMYLVSPAGTITTVAGTGTGFGGSGYLGVGTVGDGGAATAAVFGATSIALDAGGDLFIADGVNQVIRKVTPSLLVTEDATTTAVTTSTGSPVFGQAVTLTVSVGSDLPAAGTPTGTVQLMVDGQTFGAAMPLSANGTASLTTRALPVGTYTITAAYGGSAQFQASTGGLASGTIETVVGTGVPGYSGDGGSAVDAQLGQLPEGLAFDSAGNLYIADLYNQVVRKVAPDGTITTVAGNGTAGYSGDGGPATAAQLNYPFDVAVDSLGDLYIDDLVNNVIREVYSDGTIQTVAGNGTGGYSGDGGYAYNAELYRPAAIAVDQFGDLFIADSLNHVVREVTPDGIIHTVAGNGTQGYNGDGGPATAAELFNPEFIRLDAADDLFISDGGNNVVREVRAGIITTVAGDGTAGYTGDGGTASAAELEAYPAGLAVDGQGDLFIADAGNNVVREVTPTLIVSQAGTTTTVISSNVNVPYGQSVTFTATVAVVAPGAGAPTGTVTFYDGTTQLATIALNAAGQATFTTSKLSVATHTITAVYSGNANFLTSTSTVLNQSVLSAQQEAAATTTQVQALVASGTLKKGDGNSLVATLNAATASLNRGNTLVGVVQLGVFIAKVDVLALTRRLDAADAQSLIADATASIVAAVNAKFGWAM